MKIKKLLAVLLAALFVAGLLPLSGITLPAAKAETTVDWPQITEFTFNNLNWGPDATFDEGVKGEALINRAIITQYSELVPKTAGSTTKFYAGEMIIYVDGFCNNGEPANIKKNASEGQTWNITAEWNGAEGTVATSTMALFASSDDYVNTINFSLKRDKVKYYYKAKLVKYDTATLSLISAARTGEDSATIMFSSTAAGTAYSYAVVDKGAAAPASGDYSAPVEAAFAANAAVTLSLTGLTAGEKDVYIKATDANGIATKTLTVSLGNAATWPQLAALKLDPLPTITRWNKLTGYDGKIVGYKIEQHDTLQPVSEKIARMVADKTCYEAGVITMYLDKLPTENEADKTDETTAIYFKYTLPADCAEIAWNNCTPHASMPETFSGKNVSQRKKFNWESNAPAALYLRTADDTYYYYRMAAEVYIAPSDNVILKNGSATRTAKETATVKFFSSKAGKFYYIVSDTQLESPADITANETEMLQGVNSFEISGFADSAAKYVYIIGKNGNAQSEVLEVIVPGMIYKLNHEVQALEGFILVDTWENGNVLSGDFYTEKFTDANGKEITTAAPGDTVTVTFEANGGRIQKNSVETVGDKIINATREYQLQSWTIDGADIIPAPTGTTFTFTMPENDVTVQAVVAAVGVPVKMSTNLQLTRTVSIGYYNTKYSDWSSTDMLRPGDLERSHTYKLGLTLRIGEYNKPGWTVGDSDILDRIEVYNNGTLLTPTDEELYTTGITLAEGDDYEFRFVFRAKAFSQITVGANDAQMGSATLSVNGGAAAETAIAYENDTVTLTAAPGERYMLTGWKVEDIDGTAIDITASELTATFTVPSTGKAITATALFDIDPDKASAQNALISAALYGEDGALIAAADREGTRFEITLPDGYNVADLAEKAKLVLDYSPYATARLKGADSDWPAEGQGGMTVGTEYTFVITAENKRDAQEYTVVIIAPKSGDNTMTKVELLATADKAVIAEGTLEGDTWTITVTDKTVADNLTMQYLRLTYDEKATVAMAGGYGDATGDFKWRNGDVMCGMSVNQPVKFTVTAENGDTKEYTIVVKYDAPAAPELTNGTAERTSDKEATVKFTSGEAGTYYYAVVNKGATTPKVDTTKNGKNAVAGENTITLNNLTAGAREIYIVVKNAGGVESAALKVDIPAFGGGTEQPGEFKITISAPKGGTLTASKTTAGTGDTITVTATPDAGMQLVAGSLTYTLAVAGGETKKIDNFTFTMPAGDVSLTCKWETKSTTVDGITGFSINGVSGSINQTNGTISVVMPYGTDVSKLVPVISGNNITDMTPGSGVMQDFSKPVTYTVTLADGTAKTYTVTVYVQSGTAADQMWGKLTDFYNQVPWWKYAEHQQSYGKYPRYW